VGYRRVTRGAHGTSAVARAGSPRPPQPPRVWSRTEPRPSRRRLSFLACRSERPTRAREGHLDCARRAARPSARGRSRPVHRPSRPPHSPRCRAQPPPRRTADSPRSSPPIEWVRA
jgi:hypothetical protein